MTRPYDRIKRAMDLAISGTALLVASPLLAAAAVAIRRGSAGPILFRQERVGLDGRPFSIFKFRTMVDGAQGMGSGILVSKNDSRITPEGAFMRRWSIDELPQLLNVVRGDMSIVGPRPTLAYQVEQYTPEQRRRLEVRPGITGWAQVNGRNAIPWAERIALDVWYVDHRSLAVDLRVLAKTALLLVRPSEEEVYNEAQADWGEPT